MAAVTMMTGSAWTSRRCSRALSARPRRHHRRQPPGAAGRRVRRLSRRSHADGRQFIADAIARGAGAVLWEAEGFAWNRRMDASPNQPVPRICSTKLGVHRRFRLRQPVAGDCGSSASPAPTARRRARTGSPQCARPLRAERAAVVGTLGNGLVGALEPALHTTPDAARLHELAREVQGSRRAARSRWRSRRTGSSRGASTASDSTSRCSPTSRTITSTITARWRPTARPRRKLFAWPGLHARVINVDDAFGQSLADDAARARPQGADLRARQRRRRRNGDLRHRARHRAVGRDAVGTRRRRDHGCSATFNASNLLGVLGVLLASEVRLADARRARCRTSRRRRDACSSWAAASCRSSSSTTRTRPMRSRRC